MEAVGLLIGAAIVIVPIGGILWLSVKGLDRAVVQPGRSLERRFAALGTLRGQSKQQIVAAVGQPNTTRHLNDGKVAHVWGKTGYIICLRFDANGICEGVVSETKV